MSIVFMCIHLSYFSIHPHLHIWVQHVECGNMRFTSWSSRPHIKFILRVLIGFSGNVFPHLFNFLIEICKYTIILYAVRIDNSSHDRDNSISTSTFAFPVTNNMPWPHGVTYYTTKVNAYFKKQLSNFCEFSLFVWNFLP